MGGLLQKFLDKFFSKKLELCLLGLENSGKTTFVDQLHGKTKNTVPTIGLNVKQLKKGSNKNKNKNRCKHENLGYRWTISIQTKLG